MLRIDGSLAPSTIAGPLDSPAVEAVVGELLGSDRLALVRSQLELDFAFQWDERARFRGNAYHESGNLAITLRRLPAQPRTAEELGLPAEVVGLLSNIRGLILVT